MTDFFVGDRVSQWGTWQGPVSGSGMSTRAFDDSSILPPDTRWDRGIHMRRFQGDVSQWIPGDAGSLSRAQLQGPGVFPMETLRYVEFWTYFIGLAAWASDDFHMCWEIHTPSANPGGVVTINVAGSPIQQSFRQWVGPGAFTELYKAKTPVVYAEHHHHIIGYRPSVGNTGRVLYIRDGVTEVDQSNLQTTTQSGTHYPEIGFYTYWGASGTDDFIIYGHRVTDILPTYPGGAGGGGSQPAVDLTLSGGVFIGSMPFEVDITDAPAGSVIYVGGAISGATAPAPFPRSVAEGDSTFSDTVDLSNVDPAGVLDTIYAALHNSTGAQIAADPGIEVQLFPEATGGGAETAEGALAVESDSSVTISATLADPDFIIPIEEVEFALFDLPKEYEVRRARQRATGRWLRFDHGLGGLVFDPTAVSPLDE